MSAPNEMSGVVVIPVVQARAPQYGEDNATALFHTVLSNSAKDLPLCPRVPDAVGKFFPGISVRAVDSSNAAMAGHEGVITDWLYDVFGAPARVLVDYGEGSIGKMACARSSLTIVEQQASPFLNATHSDQVMVEVPSTLTYKNGVPQSIRITVGDDVKFTIQPPVNVTPGMILPTLIPRQEGDQRPDSPKGEEVIVAIPFADTQPFVFKHSSGAKYVIQPNMQTVIAGDYVKVFLPAVPQPAQQMPAEAQDSSGAVFVTPCSGQIVAVESPLFPEMVLVQIPSNVPPGTLIKIGVPGRTTAQAATATPTPAQPVPPAVPPRGAAHRGEATDEQQRDAMILKDAYAVAKRALLEGKGKDALAAAVEAVGKVTKGMMAEIADMTSVPLPISYAMTAVVSVLGRSDNTWLEIREHLTPTFPHVLQRAHHNDRSDLSPATLQNLQQLLGSLEQDEVEAISIPIATFLLWTRAMVGYLKWKQAEAVRNPHPPAEKTCANPRTLSNGSSPPTKNAPTDHSDEKADESRVEQERDGVGALVEKPRQAFDNKLLEQLQGVWKTWHDHTLALVDGTEVRYQQSTGSYGTTWRLEVKGDSISLLGCKLRPTSDSSVIRWEDGDVWIRISEPDPEPPKEVFGLIRQRSPTPGPLTPRITDKSPSKKAMTLMTPEPPSTGRPYNPARPASAPPRLPRLPDVDNSIYEEEDISCPYSDSKLRELFKVIDAEEKGYVRREDFDSFFSSLDHFGMFCDDFVDRVLVKVPGKKYKDVISFEEFAVLMLRLASR